MGQKILVTGGAGFIGSHLCEELIKKGNKVICLDNLFTGSKNNLKTILDNPNFKFVKGDVRDKYLVKKLVKEVDIVFHLAAIVGVQVVVNNPLENISVNIEGVKNIAEAALAAKKKIVFSSSSEVYGKNHSVPLDEETSDSIFGSTKVTRWAYGLTKAIGEHLLLGYGEKGLSFAIVRYFNCYGPRGINPNYANVIPKFITQALKQQPLTVYGNGKDSRCYSFVIETVRGTILAEKKLKNDIINIGSDKEISTLNLAEKIIAISKSKSKIIFIDKDKIYKRKYEDSPRRVPNVAKAKKLISFTSNISLEEGLEKTIEWTKTQI